MTLARKLIAPQLLVLALIGLVAVYQAWLGYGERRELARTAAELERVSAELNHLSQLISDAERDVLSHYLEPRFAAPERLDRTRREIASILDRIAAEEWPARGKALVEDLRASMDAVADAQRQFFGAEDQAASREAFVRWWFVAQRVSAMVADLSAYNTHRLDRAMADTRRRQEALDNTNLTLTLAAAIAAVLFAWFVIRKVVRPVAELTAATSRIGELGAKIPRLQGRDDELGTLATAIADMAERLTSSNAQLEEALRTRDHFISIAAHELKTPLTSMKLQLELLQRRMGALAPGGGPPATPAGGTPGAATPSGATPVAATPSGGTDPAATSATALRRQVERLSRLVDELLDVSRIQLGRLELNVERVELAAEIRSVATQCELVLREAGCSLELTLEPGLHAEVDRSRFEQVLVNLFANAAKYACRAPVTLVLQRQGAEARIRLRDAGPGIPDTLRPNLFQRFGRPAGAAATGLGLGLFISREVVRGLGGELELAPPDGNGAEFVIRLPLVDARVTPGPASDGRAAEAERSTSG